MGGGLRAGSRSSRAGTGGGRGLCVGVGVGRLAVGRRHVWAVHGRVVRGHGAAGHVGLQRGVRKGTTPAQGSQIVHSS